MGLQLMCKDRVVAETDLSDNWVVLSPEFMPTNLGFILVPELTIESLAKVRAAQRSNDTAFEDWCSSRTLTLDRQNAKKILTLLGLDDPASKHERLQIARAFRCASLIDSYRTAPTKSYPRTFIR
ncbi:hypothetical protein FACS1894202_13340 [Clostridia bacterium]|nr:hypothetical protein FACS1894202_13340 [Clostridia bacterium]